MSVLATDNFDRANNTDLGTLWDLQTGEVRFGIVSNTATPSGLGNDDTENYNGVTWPNDQYAQCKNTIVGTTSGTGCGPALRCSTSARTFYRAVVANSATNQLVVGKKIAGAFTSLGTRTVTYGAGKVVYLEIQGSTLQAKYDGAAAGASISDSAITTGRAGIAYSSGGVTSASADDWEGGDFAAAAGNVSRLGINLQAVQRAGYF